MENEVSKPAYRYSERDTKRIIVGTTILGLGTFNEDVEILWASFRSIDDSGTVGHEGGAHLFYSIGKIPLVASYASRSQSRKRSSGNFEDAGVKFFESSSNYFKSNENYKDEAEANSSRAVKNRAGSTLAYLNT